MYSGKVVLYNINLLVLYFTFIKMVGIVSEHSNMICFRIMSCAKGKRGRFLLAAAGRQTAQLGEQFNFVPWVVIDGQRDIDSFYALEENVCRRLGQPSPAECSPASPTTRNQETSDSLQEQAFRIR